jgi:hypothetical protein
LIIFDRTGKPRFAYQEDMGHDLPIIDIVHAMEVLRQEQETTSTGETTR